MKKTSKSLLIIIVFFIGVISTILVYKHYPDNEKEVIENINISMTNTINKSIEKVYDATVVIETLSNGKLANTGTGFVYKKDDKYGYVMTNAHVVSDKAKIEVTNNNNEKVEATYLGGDQFVDIAILKVPLKSVMAVAEIGESVNTVLGDTVFTVGAPMGIEYQGTVTKGILSGNKREVEVSLTGGGKYVMELLQTDAAINPGNSGGPLANINGEVIGVNSMKFVERSIEGMGFAIPIEIAMNAAEYLENGKTIERPLFGAMITDVNDVMTKYQYNIQLDEIVTKGALIIQVEKDSPAGEAKFEKGDVVIKINDTEIKSSAKFRTVLYSHKVGDEINVTYIRGSKEHTVKVKLNKEFK